MHVCCDGDLVRWSDVNDAVVVVAESALERDLGSVEFSLGRLCVGDLGMEKGHHNFLEPSNSMNWLFGASGRVHAVLGTFS